MCHDRIKQYFGIAENLKG